MASVEEQIIEIKDPEIDAEEIMHRIREHIRARRIQAQAQGVDFESLVKGIHPQRFDEALYREMRQVNASASQMGVMVSLVKPRRQIPVLSSLLQRIRQAAHQLVVYYVNQLASQQNHHNRQIVNVLMHLALGLERETYPQDVAALRKEVAALREELAQLKTASGSPSG